jgi:nicotinate-nucleotide adenylyltransferase
MALDPRALKAGRLGVFGGTFDPVHNGHLHVARVAMQHLGLDHIVFIPARQSPHKATGATALGEQRLKMLELAVASDEYLRDSASIWNFELSQQGPSFTVRTLEELCRLRGDREPDRDERSLVFLMGSDQFSGLPTWKDVERVFALAKPCVVLRGGWEAGAASGGAGTERAAELIALEGQLSPELLLDLEQGYLQPEPIELAATELRAEIEREAVDFDSTSLPKGVADYIAAEGLYRSEAGADSVRELGKQREEHRKPGDSTQ